MHRQLREGKAFGDLAPTRPLLAHAESEGCMCVCVLFTTAGSV